MSNDDWFERALRETEADAEADDGSGDGDEEESTARAPGDVDPARADGTLEHGDPENGASTAPAGGTSDGSGPRDVGQSADATGRDDGSPFDESFADAFQSAPSIDDGGTAGGAGAGGGATPEFGEGSGSGFDDRGSPEFDDGGAPDFGGAGGPEFGDDDPTFDSNFDEDEFDSALTRLDIGIEGLDNMIRGGIPARSLMVAIGSAGTGKTTFGLQFLATAMEQGERAVFITLEETRERILDTAEEKGWPFRTYEEEGRLAVVDLDPIEMANSLTSIRDDLPRLIENFGAERLVLDSVSLLEMMYDRPSRRRSEVFEFSRALKEAGVTTMVTSEASDETAYASRHGIIEYLADAVFVLQYVRPNNFQETRLAIEIQKIRDANHSRQPKPYEISDSGISVHEQANLF